MDKLVVTENVKNLTQEQIEQVRKAKERPIVFDDDCPELTPMLFKAFKSSVIQRNRRSV